MGENSQAKKPVNRQFSAGGVVFKKENGKVLWLVAKSTPSKLYPESFWKLPKGWIDNDGEDTPGPIARGEEKATEDKLKSTALREVKEEGGVIAKITTKVGTVRFFFNFNGQKTLKFVTFYLMEWEKDFPGGHDWETEEVAWFPYEEAYDKLHFSSEKESLKKAKEILERGVQENLI